MAGLIKAVQALRHRVCRGNCMSTCSIRMINWDRHSGPRRIGNDASRAMRERTALLRRERLRIQWYERARNFARGANCRDDGCAAPPADGVSMLAISARTPRHLPNLRAATPISSKPPITRPCARSPPPYRWSARISPSASASSLLTPPRQALHCAHSSSGAKAVNVVSGRMRSAATPEVAFLFTGQGAQYAGMGKGLYETEQVFRDALDLCDELARPISRTV